MKCIPCGFLLSAAFLLVPRAASAMPITFETIADTIGLGVVVDTQFVGEGVRFGNALALTAGLSLNELDFPPHSGNTAIRDNTGPMTVDFTEPFFGLQGFFTYNTPITLQAFDANCVLLAQVTSAFASNIADSLFADPGSSPNELIRLESFAPIARLVIAGAPSGNSFVMDDFEALATPEPSTLLLLISGLCLIVARVIRAGAGRDEHVVKRRRADSAGL